ncbi:MAG TPA: TIGR03067 domain-containing protein, partial [Fimbriiglobus sp.]
MRTLLAAILGVTFLGGASADEKFDADKLMGTWKITDGKKGTEKLTDDAKKTVVTFAKDKLTMTMNGPMGEMKFEFKYSIDAKVSPVAIDLEITKGPIGEGSKAKGILELKGDDLKIEYPPMEGDRPTKFDDG